ncbi:MAG: glycosyltransferase [Comamonas sp.]
MQGLGLQICGKMERVTQFSNDMSDILLDEPLPLGGSMRAHLREALVQLENGNYLEALGTLGALMAEDVRLPRNGIVWLYIGKVYARMGLWRNAIDALESALAFDPNLVDAQGILAMGNFNMGEKQKACSLIDAAALRKKSSSMWMIRAYIHAHSNHDPLNTLRTAQDWGRRFADPLSRKAKILAVDKNPRKKLKIGYVTADFRSHSIAFFMRPILANHNSDNVCVHVYNNSRIKDDVTSEFQSLVSSWCDVFDLNDSQMLAKIRADGIDILIDLSGFTHGNRLEVFAQRAAPVQITWVGYLPTLGMKAMDYRLADSRIMPPSQSAYYSEALFQLGCVTCYQPPEYAPLEEVPPMLRNGYPTLISLNNSSKLTDEMLGIWARILHLRTDARLIIMVKELEAGAAQAHMRPRVEAAGMPVDRVSVMNQQSLINFMELGHIADIQLDTAPISGGTTTLHALWMGLSIVTMDAERGVDVATAATLRDLECGGEICQDEEAYINAALQLMDSPERLQAQRRQAREVMLKTSWMDYSGRTAEIEKAMRVMWINYLRGDKKVLTTDVDIEELIKDYEALQ